MNKEIKKVTALLDERENKKKTSLAKAEAELKECGEKLTALNSAIEKADNAEDYKRLLQEIRDYEAVMKFCEKRITEIKSSTLSPEEYSKLKSTVKDSFDSLQNEQASIIFAEIDKLNKLLSDYDSEVDELNQVLSRACKVSGASSPLILNSQTIVNKNGDPQSYYRTYIDTYYKVKTLHFMLNRNIKK